MGKSTAFIGPSFRETFENIASEVDKPARYAYVRDVLMNYLNGWTRRFPREDSRFRHQQPFVTKPKAKQDLMEQQNRPESFVPKSHSSYNRNHLNDSNNAEGLEEPTSPPEDRGNSPEQSVQARQVSVGTLPPVIKPYKLMTTEITLPHPAPFSVQQSQLKAVETPKVDAMTIPHDFPPTPSLLPLTKETPVIPSIVEMPGEQPHPGAVLETSNDSVPKLQVSITQERSFHLQQETLNSSNGPPLDQVSAVSSLANDSLPVMTVPISTTSDGVLQPGVSIPTYVLRVPSIRLRLFIGMSLWGRQTGRKTKVNVWEIWLIPGSLNRYYLTFKGVRVKGFEMESFETESGTNASNDKPCVYGCVKEGKHQHLSGTKYGKQWSSY